MELLNLFCRVESSPSLFNHQIFSFSVPWHKIINVWNNMRITKLSSFSFGWTIPLNYHFVNDILICMPCYLSSMIYALCSHLVRKHVFLLLLFLYQLNRMQSDGGETGMAGRLYCKLVVTSSSERQRTLRAKPRTWLHCGGTMCLNHPGFISNQYIFKWNV